MSLIIIKVNLLWFNLDLGLNRTIFAITIVIEDVLHVIICVLRTVVLLKHNVFFVFTHGYSSRVKH